MVNYYKEVKLDKIKILPQQIKKDIIELLKANPNVAISFENICYLLKLHKNYLLVDTKDIFNVFVELQYSEDNINMYTYQRELLKDWYSNSYYLYYGDEIKLFAYNENPIDPFPENVDFIDRDLLK